MEEKNKEEGAAISEAASTGREGCHPRNPVSENNPNPNPISNPNPNTPRTKKGSKAKTCGGVAYYTSVHVDKSQNPTCIGFSRTLHQVPQRVLEDTKMELEASKAGRSLTIFTYLCIGYSAYLDNKNSSAGSQDKTAKLPHCFGYELLGTVRAHSRKTEEGEHAAPQPQPQPQPQRNKPPTNTENQFFTRFQKSAVLVANGVVKNLNRVGSYVKETIDDILSRRPK